MEVAAILSFGLVLLFAALAGMLSVKLRIPSVAGLLVIGTLLGPNVLALVEPEAIDAFAEIGAILLLFMIGVEFSIAKLLATGLRTVVGSMVLMLLTFVIMHETAVLLGFDAMTSLCIAAAFSMSSTAIMMKILEQKGLVGRQEVTSLVAMLIIEDIIAVFMLTVFSSLKSGAYTTEGVFGSILVSLGILGFGYVVLLKLLQKFSDIFLRYQAEDTLILFSFGLGVGMAVLASILGLAPSIGAFLAGSIIAGLPNGKEFEDAIRPFSFLFASFFFLSIGMLIDPAAVLATADLTLILIGTFTVTVFLATTFAFFLISGSGRSSVFAGLAMIPLGEFSLLIAREGIGIAQADLIGVVSLGVLITSLICSFALNRSEQVYLRLKKTLPARAVRTLTDASGYFRNVVCAFEPRGYFHTLFVSEVRALAVDLLYLIGAVILIVFSRSYLQFDLTFAGFSFGAYAAAFFVIILFSLVPLTKLLLSAKRLFDALSLIFSRTTPQASKAVILRDLIVTLVFFGIFAAMPNIVELLALPRIFNWLSFVFGVLSVFFLWGALRAASFSFSLTAGKPLVLLRERIRTSKEDIIVVGKPGAEKPQKRR